MDFYIILCSGAAGAAVGLLLGYLWRGYEDSHVWRAEEQERQYTTGAAYDAMTEPTTDYNAEAVRKLLNSW
jgi:hypothetical protein